tara:strand:- start:238 stop:1368 length:1131 start_codon:yes stop_codon:yes gene_type:complete
MGLSVVQSLLIGGGKAADVIRASDVRKSKEYNDAFNSFIDNNVGALKKASAKQKLLTGRMKKDISQIVNTYLAKSDLSDKLKYEVANTIYASHGYKLDNVQKDVASRLNNHLMNNLTETQNENTFNYVDSYITLPKDIKAERTLDQIVQANVQEIAPMPVLDLKAKAAGLGRYKESAFFSPDTDKIEQDLLSATGYTPDKDIPEGPTIQTAQPVPDLMEQQRYKNLLSSYKKSDLDRQKLMKDLETGEFDTNQINKLFKTHESNQYAKKGLASGVGSGGYLTPKDYGTGTQQARMDAFKTTVQQIIASKKPQVGEAYIDQKSVKRDLASIAKGLNPIISTQKFEVGGVYQRTLSGNKTETYIYLGEGVPEIRLSDY